MKARHVSRELALLSLSQIGKNTTTLNEAELEDIIIDSVRTLCEMSMKNLNNTIVDLYAIKEYLEDKELNDPSNLDSPIDEEIKPISIPKTDKMKQHVDNMFESIEHTLHAIEITEMSALTKKKNIRDYSIRLIQAFLSHTEEIDGIINEFSSGWQVDRIIKMDKNILRLAIAEMKYVKSVPNEVSIDEAVELAKKYSDAESPKFINGLLGQILGSLKQPEGA